MLQALVDDTLWGLKNVTLGIVWDAMRVNGIGQCSKGQIVLMRDFETPECRGLLCLRSNDRFCLIVRLSR